MFVAVLTLASQLLGSAFVFDSEKNLEDVGHSYFAPAASGRWRGRFPDGRFRYFRVTAADGEKRIVRSQDGWRGEIEEDHATIFPSSADCAAGAVSEYRFRNGDLAALVQGGKTFDFKYPEVLPCHEGLLSLWRTREDYDEAQLHVDVWAGTGRLRLGYGNPNKLAVLIVQLAILSLGILLLRGWKLRILGFLLLMGFLVALGMTESRGGLLAFGVSSAAVLLLRWPFGKGGGKLAILFSLAVFAAVVAIGYVGFRDRFANRSANRTSDAVRFEAWDRVPEMIASAPGGWNECSVGLTYVSWFQDLDRTLLIRDMMNEHLTFLVRHGWPLRMLYLSLWSAVLAFLVGFVRRGGSPVWLATWLALGIPASLNRVYGSPTLWLIPVGGLCWSLFRANWKRDFRFYGWHLAGAVALSAAVLIGVQIFGRGEALKRNPQIRCDGYRVAVNGPSPDHWVVHEPTVLSMTFTGKDIRRFYGENPQAPALGFVWEADDLPEGVPHATFFGRSCESFVKRFTANPNMRLPKKVTFVSPTLSPEEIPEDLRTRCSLQVVMGNLLARYFSKDGSVPHWVDLRRGIEFYVPDWIEVALGSTGAVR